MLSRDVVRNRDGSPAASGKREAQFTPNVSQVKERSTGHLPAVRMRQIGKNGSKKGGKISELPRIKPRDSSDNLMNGRQSPKKGPSGIV